MSLFSRHDRDLDIFKDHIKAQLNGEIAKRYYYKKGEYTVALKDDKGLAKALEILNNPTQYKEILSAPAKEETSLNK